MTAGLSALVLAGGRARRLGGHKARREVGGEELLARALALAAELADDVLLAAGDRDYRAPGARVVADEPMHAGPLGALAAGLAAARGEWVLLLPCDLPFADAGLARRLADRALAAGPAIDAVLLRDEHGIQPFHGFYRRRVGVVARELLGRDERALKNLVARLTLLVVPLPEGAGPALLDVDTPEDLARAQDLARERALASGSAVP